MKNYVIAVLFSVLHSTNFAESGLSQVFCRRLLFYTRIMHNQWGGYTPYILRFTVLHSGAKDGNM